MAKTHLKEDPENCAEYQKEIRALIPSPSHLFQRNGFSACKKSLLHLALFTVVILPLWVFMAIEPVFQFAIVDYQAITFIMALVFFFFQCLSKKRTAGWYPAVVTSILVLGYIGLAFQIPDWLVSVQEPTLGIIGVSLVFIASLFSTLPFAYLVADILLQGYINPEFIRLSREMEKAPDTPPSWPYYLLLLVIYLLVITIGSFQFFSRLQGGFQ